MSDQQHVFVPEEVPHWQMPFWESLREHELRVQRCGNCGTFCHVPKEICPSCHSSQRSWEPIAETGTVYTYTVVHRAPTPGYQAEAPYVIAFVEMDAGVRMSGRLRGLDPESARVGLPVRAAYADVTERWTLLEFSPVAG